MNQELEKAIYSIDRDAEIVIVNDEDCYATIYVRPEYSDEIEMLLDDNNITIVDCYDVDGSSYDQVAFDIKEAQ